MDTLQLYDFQINTANYIINRLENNLPVIDCSVVGAGKTFIALYALKKCNKKFILICPKIVISHWKESIHMANINHICIDVLNYEKLKTGKTNYFKFNNKIGIWKIPDNSIVIFDEAHKLKGYNTINSILLTSLKNSNLIPYLISATIANSPLDFLNVADTFNLCYNRYKWLHDFGYKKRFDNKGWVFDKNDSHLIKLHDILFRNNNHPGVRITYSDINILTNSNTIHMIFIDDIYNKINSLYNLLYTDEINISNNNNNKNEDIKFTEIMNKTQQALLYDRNCGQVLEEIEDYINNYFDDNILTKRLRLRQFIELVKSKLILSKIIQDVNNDKYIVVMFNYSWSINLLYNLLQNLNISSNIITGYSKDRDNVINQFQLNQIKVVIINIKAASVGISLHDTNGSYKRISYISPSENIYELEQALGRIYRATSKSDTNQYIITVNNTIEESVYENYINKLNMMSKILNG